MAGALRRLVYGQGTTKNWTLQATTTYNGALPADSPSAWPGTVSEMEQDFRATTNQQTALGALITFTPNVPDGFGGAVVKIATTYTTESPRLELWTHTSGGWTLRRSILISNLVVGARSGEAKVYDLLLDIDQLTGVDKVWITIKPTGAETNVFYAIHPYGSCDTDVALPSCAQFEGGCLPEIECLDPTTWTTDPDCSPPEPSSIDGSCSGCPFPDPVPSGTINLPGITLEFTVPASDYTFTPSFGYGYTGAPCNAGIRRPNLGFAMIFGDIPVGGSVLVEYLPTSGVQFNDDASTLEAAATGAAVFSQEISALGTMVWRIKAGTGFFTPFGGLQASALNGGLFPPPSQVASYRFRFTPRGNLNLLQLLDILAFFWTTEQWTFNVVC